MLLRSALRQQLPHRRHQHRRQLERQKTKDQANLTNDDPKIKVIKVETYATIQASDTRHNTGQQKTQQQNHQVTDTPIRQIKVGTNQANLPTNLQIAKGAMKIVADQIRAEVMIDQGHQQLGHLLPIRATKVAAIHTVTNGMITQKENMVLTMTDSGILHHDLETNIANQDTTKMDAGIIIRTEFPFTACRLPSGTDTDLTPKFSGMQQFTRMPAPDAGAQPRAVGCPRHRLCLKGSKCILYNLIFFEARAPPTVRFPDLAPQNEFISPKTLTFAHTACKVGDRFTP